MSSPRRASAVGGRISPRIHMLLVCAPGIAMVMRYARNVHGQRLLRKTKAASTGCNLVAVCGLALRDVLGASAVLCCPWPFAL